jgi:Zn-finger nucleic acid-binding protein/ribosomal protein L40E
VPATEARSSVERREPNVRLVACPECRTQYDATDVAGETFPCRCGAAVRNRDLPAVDLPVTRCAACGAIAGENARGCEYCGAEVTGSHGAGDLVCPECYARNPDGSRFCTACGVEFRPQPIPTAPADVDCIRCGVRMAARDVAGTTLHECPKCASLWVPGGALDALVRRVAAAAETLPAGEARSPRVQGGNPLDTGVRYRRCPECGQLMGRVNFKRVSGVVIDRCPEHGTWLDADELEEIAGFVASGGLARAAEAEAKEAARSAGRSTKSAVDAGFQRVLAEHGEGGPAWARIEKLFEKLMMRPRRTT